MKTSMYSVVVEVTESHDFEVEAESEEAAMMEAVRRFEEDGERNFGGCETVEATEVYKSELVQS